MSECRACPSFPSPQEGPAPRPPARITPSSPNPNKHHTADHDHRRQPPAEAVAPASGNDLRIND